MCAKSLQACLQDPMDRSLPGSSVRGILQTRMLEWIVLSFSRGPFGPWYGTRVSWIAGKVLPSEPRGKPFLVSAEH